MDERGHRARPSKANVALGRYGEDVAVRHLRDAGLVVIDRNWRSRNGEVDIVALDVDVLVICEVKTRSSDRFGGPVAAITPAKLSRLRRLAGEWIAAHPQPVSGIRIDVVAVMRPSKGSAHIKHLVGVQ
ncbi:MAG: YraN family protein [Candidatus Nanopelagicales bacterium]